MPRKKVTRIAKYYPYVSKRAHDAAKRNADLEVRSALAHGLLKRQPCEACGYLMAEAHHDDYSRPLDVKWLCRIHHRERDRELASARRQDAAPSQVGPRSRHAYESMLMAHPCTEVLVKAATEQVAAAMNAYGLNEHQLSVKLGVSRQSVNQWLNGGVRTLKALAVIADALGREVRIELVHRVEREKAS